MSQLPPIHSASISCVECGYDLSGSAIGGLCPECGARIERSLRRVASSAQGNGSATTCMVLGILSLTVCGILGPFAIVTYYTYQREVERGDASPNGQSMAKAGLICGWISIALLLLYCTCFGFMIIADM